MTNILRFAGWRAGLATVLSVGLLAAVLSMFILSPRAMAAGPTGPAGHAGNAQPCQYMKMAPAPSVDPHIYFSPASPFLKRGPAASPSPVPTSGTSAATPVKDCHPSPQFVPMSEVH